jgi:hypothetical protein
MSTAFYIIGALISFDAIIYNYLPGRDLKGSRLLLHNVLLWGGVAIILIGGYLDPR